MIYTINHDTLTALADQIRRLNKLSNDKLSYEEIVEQIELVGSELREKYLSFLNNGKTLFLPKELETIPPDFLDGLDRIRYLDYERPLGQKYFSSNALQSSKLQTLTIPESVQSIGEGAFSNMDSLEEVKWEAPIAIVGGEKDFKGIFEDSTIGKLTFSEEACETITEIGANAFAGSTITSFDLYSLKNLKVIGDHAFWGCSYDFNYRNENNFIFEIPRTVQVVKNSAFAMNHINGVPIKRLKLYSDFISDENLESYKIQYGDLVFQGALIEELILDENFSYKVDFLTEGQYITLPPGIFSNTKITSITNADTLELITQNLFWRTPLTTTEFSEVKYIEYHGFGGTSQKAIYLPKLEYYCWGGSDRDVFYIGPEWGPFANSDITTLTFGTSLGCGKPTLNDSPWVYYNSLGRELIEETNIDTINFIGNLQQWCERTITSPILERWIFSSSAGMWDTPTQKINIKFSLWDEESKSFIEATGTDERPLLFNFNKINPYCFYGYKNLGVIRFPSQENSPILTQIGAQAFGSSKAEKIIFDGTLEQWCNITFEDVDSNPLQSVASNGSFYLNLTNENGDLVLEKLGIILDDNILAFILNQEESRIPNHSFPYLQIKEINLANEDTADLIFGLQSFSNSGVEKINIKTPNRDLHFESRSFEKTSSENWVSFNSMSENFSPASFDDIEKSEWVDKGTYLYGKNINLNSYAFEESGIKDIVIKGENITLNVGVFHNCKALQSCWLDGNLIIDNVQFEPFYGSSIKKCYIKKTENISGDLFSSCDLEDIYIEDDNLYQIDDYAFSGLPSFQGITLKGKEKNELIKLTNIGTSAFSNCQNLTSIKSLGDGAVIGDRAFASSGIQEIDLSNVQQIGNWAFEECYSLKTIGPENIIPLITTLETSVFEGCHNLNMISGPEVTAVGYSCFENCGLRTNSSTGEVLGEGLKTADFPKAETIGSYAFKNCTSLESINAPSVKTLGTDSFRGCTSLKSINFPELTEVPNGAFWSCQKIASFNLLKVTKVGVSSIQACYGLTSIRLPSVTNLQSQAFAFCSSLSSVTLGNKNTAVTYIGKNAFKNTAIIDLTIFYDGTRYSDPTKMTYYPWGLTDTKVITFEKIETA